MPVGRAWARLMHLRDREISKARDAERKFRIHLWVQASMMFQVGLMHQQPPETQAEFNKRQRIERGKAQPNWGRIEDARRRRDAHDEAMQDAMNHPYHFESHFRFANAETGEGHLFPEPPRKPTKEDRIAYYERKGRESTQNVIDMLKKIKAGRARRRRAGQDIQRNPDRAEQIKREFERDLADIERARAEAE